MGVRLQSDDFFPKLGHLYRLGLGVEQDTKKAVEYYEKAAEYGRTFHARPGKGEHLLLVNRRPNCYTFIRHKTT